MSREKVDEFVAYLSAKETEITENRKILEKDVRFIQKQLDALGEKVEEEDAAITRQREELSQQLSAQDKLLKEADLLIIKTKNYEITGR